MSLLSNALATMSIYCNVCRARRLSLISEEENIAINFLYTGSLSQHIHISV